MRTAENAYNFLSQRTVGILVEPRLPGAKPYVWTGFVVDVDGHWLLLTAAHCITQIAQWLEADSEATLTLLAVSETDVPIQIRLPRCKWNPADLQKSLTAAASSFIDVSLTEQDLHFYDMAFWAIPDLEKAYLQNAKVRPFAKEEWLDDGTWTRNCEHAGYRTICVAGFPEKGVTFNTEGRMSVTFQVFPLHPNPEMSRDQSRTVEGISNQALWIPTSWNPETWNQTVSGVSGGPVVVELDGSFLLLGVVTHERTTGKCPSHLAVCSPMSVLERLKFSPLGAMTV